MNLYRVKIGPMPDNPARDRSGDPSGLWMTVIYKRRGPSVEDEDFQRIDQEDMTFEEARQRSATLKKQWADAD
jgi:hypothetical protein